MSAAEEGAMKPDVQQDDAKIPSARANGRKTAIAPVICRRDSLPPREETVRCKSLQKGVLGSGQPDYDIELHVLEFPVAVIPHSKAWNIKDMMPKARLGPR